MKTTPLLLIACLLVAAVSSQAAEPAAFTFQRWFAGDWSVMPSEASLTGQIIDVEGEEEPQVQFYKIRASEGAESLAGTMYNNDTATGDISNEMEIFIEFEGDNLNAGSFRVGGSEDDAKELFKFNFQLQSNGLYASHGEWHGTTKGYYQFQIAPWDRFTITVFPKDLSGENPQVKVFSGQRVVEEVEKTFFQKYGTMLMIGTFFIINTFVQKQTRAQMAQGNQPAAGGAPTVETAERKKDN